ncbi:MAG: 1-phosphofructokinase [Methanotrichaceae archaeon]|nr:1-phosphofructokinase [Methanotrichaceae archaeon]
MIYTITLNPALDRTIMIDRIREDVSNRISEEHSYAGGKSIDVSKVLKVFDIDNIALGFVGGFAGRELEGRLLNEGIQSNFVRVSGETRTNIVIHEKETGKQLAFSASGPEVKPHELTQLIEMVENFKSPEIIAIGGSLPLGVSPEIYRKIITIGHRLGARVALDVDGAALEVGLQAQPNIIKPNIHELSELVGRDLNNRGLVLEAARELNSKGIEIVLVSMSAKGILLVSKKCEYLAVPPEVEVKNTIGAGDSAVAGFIFGWARHSDLKRSLMYAVAAGTATTLRPGTALCEMRDFDTILQHVRLEVISETK